MAKFKIASAGSKDGNHWIKIQKEEGVFKLNAFLNVTKELKPGESIEVPDVIANEIKWKP